jgi:hypothetical protein
MTPKTKAVLHRSLEAFKQADQDNQDSMVIQVIQQLDRHRKGLESIGIGLDPEMVLAGRLFLRIKRNSIPLPF